MRADSREYLDLNVQNPTSLAGAVEVSFDGGPWSATTTVQERTVVLVGPGTDHEFAPGVHTIAVRFVAAPEIPVLDAGRFYVEPVDPAGS